MYKDPLKNLTMLWCAHWGAIVTIKLKETKIK